MAKFWRSRAVGQADRLATMAWKAFFTTSTTDETLAVFNKRLGLPEALSRTDRQPRTWKGRPFRD